MARILVIDDEPLARYTMRYALENSGHSVVEAENGRQGLDLYESEWFDLTITDILMPEKDGIQTIQEFKWFRADGKIIAVTGGGMLRAGGRLNLAENTGADSILEKPFTDDQLIKCVDACLSG